VPGHLGDEKPPPAVDALLQHVALFMQPVATPLIATFEVQVESGWVCVAVPAAN